MDPYYDEPRSVPTPTAVDQIPSHELVPEVSFIGPSNLIKQKKSVTSTNKESYNMWKTQNQYCFTQSACKLRNKENILPCELKSNQNISKFLSAKQVRFNNPHIQKQILEPSNDCDNNLKSISKLEGQKCSNSDKEKTNTLATPFERIYMANIPNRNLDLSIIESSANSDKIPQKMHAVDTNDVSKKSNENFDSIINYYELKNQYASMTSEKVFSNQFKKHTEKLQPKTQQTKASCISYNYEKYEAPVFIKSNTCKSNTIESRNIDNERTIKDLLEVVQQQNEQILLLQKQVSHLLQNQSNQKQSEVSRLQQTTAVSQEYISTTKFEHHQPLNQELNSRATVSKFAVDVMTSFEVSLRQPPTFSSNKPVKENEPEKDTQQIDRPELNVLNKEKPCCDNILDNIKCPDQSSIRQNVDVSLMLDEPLQVIERCPSPENSVHVDMQDYSSDSDDESTESSSDIGWTIYNNVMEQVNNILKKATNSKFANDSGYNITGDKTSIKVKEATMQHLKSIGVNLSVIKEPNVTERSDEMRDDFEYTPTEISFAVKQLLMKYLPNDQLAKISQVKLPSMPKQKRETENLIKRRPEFSFATVQYMKKYNLLTSDFTQTEVNQANRITKVPKILDVTALKQQPKLL